ncbi:hypothetical protein BDR26DRAFT_824091 [Obelidium mucronatum]|nr:hypothetical protein BDR26DRAFT_824091 [Obelidium mucronatum]
MASEAEHLAEWDRQWSVVTVNPDDFASWESLLRLAESAQGPVTAASEPQTIANLRSVFDAFLTKFPLCFGYWKKYADAEMRIEGKEKAEEVFERAVSAIHNSIDLWIHYCQFKVDNSQDVDDVRATFERGAQGVGHDFLSHTFWDKYIDYEETRQQDPAKVLKILERVIRIPLHQYARYFEKYSTISASRPPIESLDGGNEDYERLSAGLNTEDKDFEAQLRQKIHTLKSEIYLKTQESVHKSWAFESEIKRPYFHIKPMDEAQLSNWRKYLDFEENAVEAGTSEVARLYVLYERCLVACALYEEFWLRYGRYLVVKGDFDGAKSVYARAADLFLAAGRTELRLEYAAFEEEHGRIQEAEAIFAKLMENVPGHVETLYKYAHFMRRNYGIEKAEECFVSSIAAVSDEKAKGFLIASHAKFVYSTKGVEEARRIYRDALPLYSATSKSLVLQNFLFELNLPPTSSTTGGGSGDNLDPARIAWEALSGSNAFTEYEKLMFGHRYADFLNERGTDLVAYRAVLQALHLNYRMPTAEDALQGGSGRKRGLPGGDDDKAYKMAKIGGVGGPVTPIVAAALPHQQPNAVFGGYGQPPVQQQQWGGSGGYGGGYQQGY